MLAGSFLIGGELKIFSLEDYLTVIGCGLDFSTLDIFLGFR